MYGKKKFDKLILNKTYLVLSTPQPNSQMNSNSTLTHKHTTEPAPTYTAHSHHSIVNAYYPKKAKVVNLLLVHSVCASLIPSAPLPRTLPPSAGCSRLSARRVKKVPFRKALLHPQLYIGYSLHYAQLRSYIYFMYRIVVQTFSNGFCVCLCLWIILRADCLELKAVARRGGVNGDKVLFVARSFRTTRGRGWLRTL